MRLMPIDGFLWSFSIWYADYMMGLLMTYETPNYLVKDGKRVSGLPGHKFDGGPVIPQLVYSTDGSHFLRGERKSIIENFNFPCIYPTCIHINDSSIRTYASVTSEEHGRVTPGKGGIAIYEWRKDGFVSLRFSKEGGLIITRQFVYHGGPLHFNINALQGEVKIQIGNDDNQLINGFSFDECRAFSGDETDHQFKFDNRQITELQGQILVISVRASSADLFSITGEIEWITPYQALSLGNRKIFHKHALSQKAID
jgi:hypothetical protein